MISKRGLLVICMMIISACSNTPAQTRVDARYTAEQCDTLRAYRATIFAGRMHGQTYAEAIDFAHFYKRERPDLDWLLINSVNSIYEMPEGLIFMEGQLVRDAETTHFICMNRKRSTS